MRILHLVDFTDHASTPSLACAAAISSLQGAHSVWAIGSSNAAAPWLRPARRFGAPIGNPLLSWRSLQRELRAQDGSFDVVTCWSIDALAAYHAAAPRSSHPLVGVIATEPHRRASVFGARLRRAALDRATLLCFSETAARRRQAEGAVDVRVASPAVRFDLSTLPSRDEARAALGIDPDERVLGLLADPPSIGNARRFAYLAGLLSVGGAPCVALVGHECAQVRRGARFVRDCGRLWRLVPCRGPLALALPACDAAVIDTQVMPSHPLLSMTTDPDAPCSAEVLGASLAAQLGIPTVAPRVSIADELQRAGVPVVVAADTACLSLAAALFPFMDGTGDGAARAPFKPEENSLDVLREIWLERLNAPLPGFPLAPSMPIPRAANISMATAVASSPA